MTYLARMGVKATLLEAFKSRALFQERGEATAKLGTDEPVEFRDFRRITNPFRVIDITFINPHKQKPKDVNMQRVGLGNTRISTDQAQKPPLRLAFIPAKWILLLLPFQYTFIEHLHRRTPHRVVWPASSATGDAATAKGCPFTPKTLPLPLPCSDLFFSKDSGNLFGLTEITRRLPK